jgi:DNA polymerase-3 subunit gamma/tau
MSYTVLARKYRSWTFDEIVGQDAIAQTLKNAITSGRIHHAYLFTGTRGVGKTSMARILARSLNCLRSDGPTVNPCRECESCVAVAEGQDVDVIEIDAASHTGVDNIRELRANAIYRPARARYKIYTIDEVHMLSTGAFNALLKTLEEPPEHVKFILATTDPQKVPATIHSRCQRFDFRSISPEQIGEQINRILRAEGCKADEAVVRRVARLANGSMRDALSLLDQLMSMSPKKLSIELLEEVLPTPHDQILAELIDRWAEHDAAGALGLLDKCISQGYSLDRFCDAMIEQLRTLMLINVCGPDTPLVDVPAQFRDEIVARAARFDPAAYVHRIAVLEDLRRNVRFSQAGRALADAVVVRLSETMPHASISRLLAELEGGGGDAASADAEKKKGPPAVAPAAPAPAPRAAPRAAPATAPPASRVPAGDARPARPAAPARLARPAAAPSAPPIPMKRASSDDIQAARSEPLVKKALELFDGSLVNVEHLNHGAANLPDAEGP